MMHSDEFELNMDLAPAVTGAPDYTLDEKVLGPRFESAPWSLLYLKHQRDGQFWRIPVRPLSEVKIPCFLIGGLLDGYRESIPRGLQQTLQGLYLQFAATQGAGWPLPRRFANARVRANGCHSETIGRTNIASRRFGSL